MGKPALKMLPRLLVFLSCTGCAVMHHTQVGEVDSEVVLEGERFELLLSEVGVNVDEAAVIAAAVAGKRASKQVGAVQDIIKMFQMGPRTGNPVFDEAYSDRIITLLKKACPSGRLSGLISIRETAKYPVVSGELVKLVGYCLREKG